MYILENRETDINKTQGVRMREKVNNNKKKRKQIFKKKKPQSFDHLYVCIFPIQGTVINFDIDKLPLAPDVLNTWAHLISTASADFRGPKRRSRHNSDGISDYGKKTMCCEGAIFCGLFIYLFIYLFICLFVCLFVCLFIL